MIKSMTGFGIAEAENNEVSISVEIKTLNSKFLDANLRLPKTLQNQEINYRNLLQKLLVRGKTSASINLNLKTDQVDTTATINQELFERYFNKYKDLQQQSGVDFQDIMKITLESPEVLKYEDPKLSDASLKLIEETISNACGICNTFRIDEGKSLASVLTSYNEKIKEQLEAVQAIEKDRIPRLRDRIKEKIAEVVAKEDFDQDRLEQELIFYSEKLDINEEIERLSNHLQYFEETLHKQTDSHGKKLGFIAQEMGREINTLGSKSNDSQMQKHVIIMKEELEKIKEQILNVL